MFSEHQVDRVRRASAFVKVHLPLVKKMHPTFENGVLVCMIKPKDIDSELTKKLKHKIDQEQTLIYIKFYADLKHFDVEYNKIDFSKLPQAYSDVGYFITKSMWERKTVAERCDETEIHDILKKTFAVVMEQISAVNQIIFSPDLKFYNDEIKRLWEEEKVYRQKLDDCRIQTSEIYKKKAEAYRKLIGMVQDF